MNRTDDECYVGTGPAAEVAERRCMPTYAELLAQMDELASFVRAYMERDELTRITNSVLYADASAALSRIKGA